MDEHHRLVLASQPRATARQWSRYFIGFEDELKIMHALFVADPLKLIKKRGGYQHMTDPRKWKYNALHSRSNGEQEHKCVTRHELCARTGHARAHVDLVFGGKRPHTDD